MIFSCPPSSSVYLSYLARAFEEIKQNKAINWAMSSNSCYTNLSLFVDHCFVRTWHIRRSSRYTNAVSLISAPGHIEVFASAPHELCSNAQMCWQKIFGSGWSSPGPLSYLFSDHSSCKLQKLGQKYCRSLGENECLAPWKGQPHSYTGAEVSSAWCNEHISQTFQNEIQSSDTKHMQSWARAQFFPCQGQPGPNVQCLTLNSHEVMKIRKWKYHGSSIGAKAELRNPGDTPESFFAKSFSRLGNFSWITAYSHRAYMWGQIWEEAAWKQVARSLPSAKCSEVAKLKA